MNRIFTSSGKYLMCRILEPYVTRVWARRGMHADHRAAVKGIDEIE